VITPLAILFAILGGAWGYASDRIAVRWPEHDEDDLPAGRARGWRTAVTVAAGAVGLGAVPLAFDQPIELAVFGAAVVALILLFATDLDQRLLPNVLTLTAIPLALLFTLSGANPLVPSGALVIAIPIALILPIAIYLFSLPFGAGAFGLGDVKLLISLGLLVGPWRLIIGVLYGFFVAGAVLVVLLLARRLTLKSFIPMGPFLIIGALWAILGPG
jgi:leader peptidase (prepilin peptidase) / N-methyltransferase